MVLLNSNNNEVVRVKRVLPESIEWERFKDLDHLTSKDAENPRTDWNNPKVESMHVPDLEARQKTFKTNGSFLYQNIINFALATLLELRWKEADGWATSDLA